MEDNGEIMEDNGEIVGRYQKIIEYPSDGFPLLVVLSLGACKNGLGFTRNSTEHQPHPRHPRSTSYGVGLGGNQGDRGGEVGAKGPGADRLGFGLGGNEGGWWVGGWRLVFKVQKSLSTLRTGPPSQN